MKAVFLDRDGVVNRERADYVKSWAEFEFLPGSKEGIALLCRNSCKVFVITNQSGVARGVVSEESILEIHRNMVAEVEAAGGRIEEVYYCGHHPEDMCRCRKPEIGLFERAFADHGIDPQKSYMVGDKQADIEAGKRAGCRTILVRTGYGMNYSGPRADFVADDILEAAKIIVGGN